MSVPAPSPPAPAEVEPHFTRASREVLAYLRTHVPLGFWAVTRVENGRQTYLLVEDEVYGLRAGGSHPWSASFCISMAAGAAPNVAPDAQAVPLYAQAGVNDLIPIGAYAGAAIGDVDGQLFGAICGLDPKVQPEDLAGAGPTLIVLSRLLSLALAADRELQATRFALLEARLAADSDALTGLHSRRAWEALVAEEAQRFAAVADPTAVLMVDLDGLKEVNDGLGHAAGDALIVRAAAAIRSGVRTDDPVARLGGDEFGVLLRECTEESARSRAEHVRQALAAAGVEASVGVAAVRPDEGVAAAVSAADEEMYREKRGDRRRRDDRR